MTIKTVSPYQPAKPIPDKADIVRMQQQPIQAINEILGRLADTGWQYVGKPGQPIFQNGWASAFDYDLAYRRTGDRVYLRGIVAGGSAANAVVCTLPDGYRPTRLTYCPANTSIGASIALLKTNGELSMVSGGLVGGNYFEGVFFWIDQ
jgi:hypothetical protein